MFAVTVQEILPSLLTGARLTAELTLLSAVLAFAIAVPVGVALTARSLLVRGIARSYVEFFRGTSLVVQLFWLFYALPAFGVQLEPITTGVLGLGLCVGAYGSEVVRGAITAVPTGQLDAAVALNMSPLLRVRRVVLPQAMVAMLPPFGNLLIELLKSTSLVSLITLSDLTFRGELLRAATGDTATIYITVLLMYFAMAMVLTLGVRALERRVSRGLDIGHHARVN